MSALEFLAPVAPGTDIEARSPMEALAADAGARFAFREGWKLAVSYPAASYDETVSWCDTSHLSKLQLQGEVDESLPFGTAVRRDGAWWCRLTSNRALVVGARPDVGGGLDVIDVTSVFASLTISGPLATECFARFCALDLRPAVTPVHALRPGSIARQPGTLIREADERYLILFGWATAEYVWSVVADAAGHLGGGPVGVDQLSGIDTHQPTPST
jgi:glycine cleavage system aminomethyltransferase T